MTDDARQRLALALDMDDLVVALRIARRLQPWFGVAKVGLELFGAAGPETVSALVVEGFRVFLDLKLYDIPTTVRRAATVLGGLGVAYTTVHTQGGLDMVRAAVEGMHEGASAAGAPEPCVLGVTVLTSDTDASEEMIEARTMVADSAGCGGIVCAASDLAVVRRVGPDLVRVVPGIRPLGVSDNDQARPSTPTAAISAGADVLVVGRAVTAAPDPEAAAAAILDEVARSTAAHHR
ncbi:MAG: orotidine-5'-phosphate decarboxylase [Acidimicrobiales bacterium]